MSFDFHDQKLTNSYALREANASWIDWVHSKYDLRGKKVLDLGCGGGIYSRALAELGAAEVLGMDFSNSMLEGARNSTMNNHQIDYQQGNALCTGLMSAEYDFILQRALLHHVEDLGACLGEAYRLLRSGGQLMIQDRTPEDCILPGSETHIRGYFTEKFPRLIDFELGRRHESKTVQAALQLSGFTQIQETQLWEVRQVYSEKSELRADLLCRKGRSILHELSDEELVELVDGVEASMSNVTDKQIIEMDRWTIWTATK